MGEGRTKKSSQVIPPTISAFKKRERSEAKSVLVSAREPKVDKGRQLKPNQLIYPKVSLILRRVWGNRYGACAFSTLEGYVGRGQRYGVVLRQGVNLLKRSATVQALV